MKTWLLFLSFPLVSTPAHAWGPVGHRLVARIAMERLTPRARQAVDAILGRNRGGDQVTLENIANCADNFSYGGVRRCADAFMNPQDPAKSRPWHYISMLVSDPAPNLSRYCPNGQDCVTVQLLANTVELSKPFGPGTSQLTKQVALSWVVHLMGDIHQPFHCANDGNDLGANMKPVDVEYKGKRSNLHMIWDDAIEEAGQVDWRKPLMYLQFKTDEVAFKVEDDLARMPASWVRGSTFDQAAAESWYIAKLVIYAQYKRDQGRIGTSDAAAISDKYRTQMQALAYQRIAMAGMRLADVLNTVFDDRPMDQGLARSLRAENWYPGFTNKLFSSIKISFD